MNAILSIESIRRLRNNRNGNPAFEVTLSNGETVRTAPNSMVAFTIQNNEYWNVPLRIELNASGQLVNVDHVNVHKGWTISKDRESGLQFIRRPDGTKYGQTQTEAAARIMRRRAIERADEEARILGERETQSDRDAWYDMDR